jgi:hypothetical protein
MSENTRLPGLYYLYPQLDSQGFSKDMLWGPMERP